MARLIKRKASNERALAKFDKVRELVARDPRFKEYIVASSFDLAPRLAALQAQGLTIESEYRGDPAKWLVTALDGVDVHVVNAKGIKTNDTLCMIRLVKLEQLLAAAAETTLEETVKVGV